MHQLLVTGYIRQIEKACLETLVPNDIKTLCIEYYRSDSTVILLRNKTENNPFRMWITDISADQKDIGNTVWRSASAHWGTKECLSRTTLSWDVETSGLCCASNVPLPPHIVQNAELKSFRSANVIFKVGSQSNDSQNHGPLDGCFATIINQVDLVSVQSSQIVSPYLWKLPALNTINNITGNEMTGSTLIYSNRFGLVLFGGQRDRKCVLNLPFEGIDKMDAFHVQNEWKWKTLCKGDDGSKSRDMACVMINEKTALTMGGCNVKRNDISDTKAVDIFDFETREWIPLRQSKYARSRAGIAYDHDEQRVYCIGGSNMDFPINKCEYLDLAKNQWIRLPNTNAKHSNWPLVWKHPNHRNVLLVASPSANAMESYDLREAWKCQYDSGWNMVYGLSFQNPLYDADLFAVFEGKKTCKFHCKQNSYKFNGRLFRCNDGYL